MKPVFLIPILAGTLLATAAQLELASGGASDYVIHLPSDATPAERTAAEEFRRFFAESTGAQLPVVSEPDARNIHIGGGEWFLAACPDLAARGLRDDEIVIRTRGDDLILGGARPRGSLYAVYEWLETELGIRFWSSRENLVPRHDRVVIADTDTVYAPQFISREAHFCDTIRNPGFAARLKNNGTFQNIGAKYGSNFTNLGGCHTFNMLLPPGRYFAEHPEYYALIDGVRSASQPCLSNPDVRKIIGDNVLAELRRYPGAPMISVSQNDNGGYCRCPECAAFDEREGSPAGLMLLLANEAAARVDAEFPGIRVETFAYMYTRKAPKTIRPAPNVIVRLCSLECDFARPLNAATNAGFFRDLQEWSEIAPGQLAIWDYVVNFSNFLTPYPNWNVLEENIRIFRDHGVIMVMEQGDHQSGGMLGDLIELRSWVLSKLLWNPDLDYEALTAEFLAGYYGAAAPYVRQYMKLMSDEVNGSGIYLDIYITEPYWLSLPAMYTAYRLFAQAKQAVADSPTALSRVKRASLAVDFAFLSRAHAVKWYQFRNDLPAPVDTDRLLAETVLCAEMYGVEKPCEHGDWGQFVQRLRDLAAVPQLPLPNFLSSVPPREVIDLPASAIFSIPHNWPLPFGDDPNAIDGRAICLDDPAKLPQGRFVWQRDIFRYLIDGPGEFQVWASVRRDGPGPAGKAFAAGSLDMKNGHRVMRDVDLAEFPASTAYRWIDIGTIPLNSTSYLVLEPAGAPNAGEIRFDRLIMVRQ